MIFQHRRIVSRQGKLESRNTVFRKIIASLDGHGSRLIGAWEVLVGPDAGCAIWQLRQFADLTAWDAHQNRVRADENLREHHNQNRTVDMTETAILRQVPVSPALPEEWPAVESVISAPRGYVEQRTMWFQPGTTREHHKIYQEEVAPALERDGVRLIGLFDTYIGPGTSNGASARSIELRRFDSLDCWQQWKEGQDSDPALRELMRSKYMQKIVQVDSALMRPLDYSRIR
ncbi:hypothetical protein CAL26_01215 [Bordetella genomosp. 9]|uniref:NIPSNAP domain-containing protein n=1 Tax=Bordetella genomosp. 9 TaxID=1416803 RepID=A0A261RMK5_9BORD|nr:NIPSNAP family protein [Bordetella genomosp. 9]OZI26007.1 hypothetical protein CAL26_01215 [Bordetella genomosp. 9]